MLALLFRKLLTGTLRKQGFSMSKKQIITYVVMIVAILGVGGYSFYLNTAPQPIDETEVNGKIQSPTSQLSQNSENSNTNLNSSTRSESTSNVRFKTEAELNAGKILEYNNSDYGIKFKYNQEAYTAPKIIKETNPANNNTLQNVIILSDNSYVGEWETATGYVRIYRENNRPDNFLAQEEKRVLSYQDAPCVILSKADIDGQSALRYKCSEMGDGETVLIKHPKGFYIRVEGAFTKKYFDELVKSISLLI